MLDKDEFHDGIDIAVSKGTEVHVPCNGAVFETGNSATYGKYIKIDLDGGYRIMFAHLSEVLTSKGESVSRNDVVALSGSTGLVTGPHLHYTIWKDGELTDPMTFVQLKYTNEVVDEYVARGDEIR